MEIVHDLAPGAELLFCAPATGLDMVACINFLAGAVDVIVDDLFTIGEPNFEDGMVADAAAAAVAAGVVYVSSAGNEARRHYQGMFLDSNDGKADHLIKTGNTTFNVKGNSVIVALEWANPVGQAADDYDLCFASESPGACAAFNEQQDGDDDPIEVDLLSCPSGCALQVRRVSGSAQLFEPGCSLEPSPAPTPWRVIR